MLMSCLATSLAIAQTAANSAQSPERSGKSPNKSRSSDAASHSKSKDIHDKDRTSNTGEDNAPSRSSQKDEKYRLQLFAIYG